MKHILRPLALFSHYFHVYEHSQKDDKLDDLQRGEVPLPPEILLDLGTQAGQEVVAVHYDVDAAVEGRPDHAVSAGKKVDVDPREGDHGAVVVHVQEGQLIVLSPQDEEDRVQQLQNLGEVVEPEGRGDAHWPRARGVVHGLARPVVVPHGVDVLESVQQSRSGSLYEFRHFNLQKEMQIWG